MRRGDLRKRNGEEARRFLGLRAPYPGLGDVCFSSSAQ